MSGHAPSGAGAAPPARIIAFFGHDRHDSAIRKRVSAFERHGARVIRFMFHRERPNLPPMPADGAIELGATLDLAYGRRLASLLSALRIIRAHASALRSADIVYARNLDMLALAAAARRLAGSRAPLVYEALDVRRVMVGHGAVSRLFRFAERRLLAMCDALVVSSPDYMSRYFWPVQGFTGQWRLIENKLVGPPPAAIGPPPDRGPSPPQAGEPWIIGWFGVLKCRRSLDILTRVAEALGPRCVIQVRGIVSDSEIPPSMVAGIASRHANIVFAGPYANPDDLSAIYGQVHITWAADFLDPEANSAWCLPNRLYEGGAHGSVLLASGGTATAARIERDRLGWTLDEPLEETTPAFLAALDSATYRAARRAVQEAPQHLFYDIHDTADLLEFFDSLVRRERCSTVRPPPPIGLDGAGGCRAQQDEMTPRSSP
ncbi:MAG: glycosyltransferase [Hyphomicrobium sp.]